MGQTMATAQELASAHALAWDVAWGIPWHGT